MWRAGGAIVSLVLAAGALAGCGGGGKPTQPARPRPAAAAAPAARQASTRPGSAHRAATHAKRRRHPARAAAHHVPVPAARVRPTVSETRLNPRMAAVVKRLPAGTSLPVRSASWTQGNRLTVTVDSARFLCGLSRSARLRAIGDYYRTASRTYHAAGGLSLLVEAAGAGATPLGIANPGGAMLSARGSSPSGC